jgi:hypothetical protein
VTRLAITPPTKKGDRARVYRVGRLGDVAFQKAAAVPD